MKIIISHNQYNIIKESYSNKGVDAIIKYWKKELEKGNEIRFDFDDLQYWGITKSTDRVDAKIAFQNLVGDEVFAEKFIRKLLDKKFSTKDFSEKLVGGYNFEWVITDIEYKSFDFFLYGKTLPGGSVSVMDGRHLSLEEALEDDEIGWEIQKEVDDIVEDCMNEIILPVTGYDITVPVIYIY